MHGASSASQRFSFWLALILLALPAVVFYSILWSTSVDLPIFDDYRIILDFMNLAMRVHGPVAKLLLAINDQHNGYKLIFEHLVVLTQFAFVRHIHIWPLLMSGNALVIIIFAIVALMFRPDINLDERLMLLTPAAYFIFQLQYASALNFASSSLQHIAVIAFSVTSIYCLSKQSKWSFAASCIALVLAAASSPNGFFVIPVALLMLIQQKSWQRIGLYLILAAVMLVIYLFGYQGPGRNNVRFTVPHFSLMYALSFLGASATRYNSSIPGFALGLLLCCVFAVAIKRRYYFQNSAVFYSIVFILINALAVSGLRSDQGVAQSLASRYRLYSSLMLTFSYIFLVESFVSRWESSRARRQFVVSALLASMIFCAMSDIAGGRFLQTKKLALRHCYRTQWLHQGSSTSTIATELNGDPVIDRQLQSGVYNVIVPIMTESVRLGIYQPPQNP
jgi:hypothetical protein